MNTNTLAKRWGSVKENKMEPEKALEKVVLGGDLNSLSGQERVWYHNKVCESLGLNPLTRPFDYLSLNGKLTLYPRKECAEQLRDIHGISTKILSKELIGEIYVVTVQASTSSRAEEATGAVPIKGLNPIDLANAYMKCETKAKRRATFGLCGLSYPGEPEDIAGSTVLTEEEVEQAQIPQQEKPNGRGHTEDPFLLPIDPAASALKPGELYEGTIRELERREMNKKTVGKLVVDTTVGELLVCGFFSRPESLKAIDLQDWPRLIDTPCVISFVEKPAKDGLVWRHVETLDLVEGAGEEVTHDA